MKIAIIGFGRMGRRFYNIITSLGFNVCFIFDANSSLIQIDDKVITPLPPNAIIDILKADPPNLVIIATPAESHFYYLNLCYENKIPYVICEKPLCTSVLQCEQLLKSESDNNNIVKVAVNHQMRFMESYIKVKDILNSGKIGNLCSIAIQAGNIGLAMNATHYLEMLRYLSNEYAHKIIAWLNPQSSINPRGGCFQDYAGSLRVETPSGIRMYMDISENQGHGIFVTYTGNYGQIYIDELSGNVYVNHRKNPDEYKLESIRYALPSMTESYNIPPIDVFSSTKSVILALLNDADYPTLTQAIMPIKTIVSAFYSSENEHKEVLINSLPQHYIERIFAWA